MNQQAVNTLELASLNYRECSLDSPHSRLKSY